MPNYRVFRKVMADVIFELEKKDRKDHVLLGGGLFVMIQL